MKRIAVISAKIYLSRFRVVASLILSFLVVCSLHFTFIGNISAQMPTSDTNLSRADASFIGEDSDDNSGCSVASAGDVNGDGYDDILIGAYGDDDGGSYAGQTYLILGKAIGWTMDTDLSAADASFIGEDDYDYSGCSVASAGDVNGDGYDDVLIGAPGGDDGGSEAGKTYLILGKAEGWAMDIDLSVADASFIGMDAGDHSGLLVASSGDINGDGYDDIVIGAQGNNDGGDDAGQTYLILGKAEGWAMDTDLSTSDASFIGEDKNDYSGCSVASAGDVNGDGYDDILIGASGDDDGGTGAGQTYLILGKAEGWAMDTDLSMADASFWGEEEDDHSGCSIASAGDVNGDGYDDIIIGAFGNDDGGAGAGQTYLILGKAEGWAMDTDLSMADASFWGEDKNDNSGWSIALAGDVNGDGYDDILIGAPYPDQTYLILGKTEGWAMDTDLSEADAWFLGEDDDSGYSIALAGDVNGDSYDDILIGARYDDDGGARAGQTYLLLRYAPPNQPSNVSPINGTVTDLTPTLSSSAFSDDINSSHAATQWQMTTTPGGYSSPTWNSGADASNLTSITISDSALNDDTTYYWHVRYQNTRGAWSEWSAETSFSIYAEDTTPASSDEGKGGLPFWIWIVAGGGFILIVLVGILVRRRMAQRKA